MSNYAVQLDGSTGAGRADLGGKAWSIEQMRAIGIPVPPAFALSTTLCRQYYRDNRRMSPEVWEELPAAMDTIGAISGRRFGDPKAPLLVSVRSGAVTSMPGMMDTILNLGMNDDIEKGLALTSGDAAYAADTRRRFIEQFERVVGSVPPDDPWEQLRLAVVAVLDSWQSRRAIAYRRDRGIPGDGGTAVTVQAMVFGNIDDQSGTGVLFSRDPLTGSATPYGEWLPRGQGEDVVGGRSNALPISELAERIPHAYADLMAAAKRLEKAARDVQDIEFTIESGTLWLLQTRSAKRTAQAAVRHAIQLQSEGMITTSEALDRVTPESVEKMIAPHIDPAALRGASLVAAGKPACQGVAVGVVVTDVDEAEDRAHGGESIILARRTTDPDDVAAMSVVAGVLTELGGATSHAAVVCRELNVPCIVACGQGLADWHEQEVTLDATTGTIYAGRLPLVERPIAGDPDLELLRTWAQDLLSDSSPSLPDLLRQYHATARLKLSQR